MRDQIRGFNYGVHLLLSDDRQKILRYPNKTGKIDTWYAGEYMVIYGDLKPSA